jgi:hypothetical protein
MSDGQLAFPGQIILKQRGMRFKAGEGVGVVGGRSCGWRGAGCQPQPGSSRTSLCLSAWLTGCLFAAGRGPWASTVLQ